MSEKPVAAGKSSFDLIDTVKTFELMDIQPGSRFLDLACGIGKYSIEIAEKIGNTGTVYAVDLWQEGIVALKQEIETKNIKNINAILADISKKLPLEEDSIDSCLMATILHDLSESDQKITLHEAARVIKPDGMLTIIEFKKIDKGPGPPIDIRINEEQVDALVAPHGFIKLIGSEIGAFNYLSTYKKIR